MLCDHDRRKVGCSSRDGRHDRSVRNRQTFDPVNRSTSVGDRSSCWIRAHRTRANRMMERRDPLLEAHAARAVRSPVVTLDPGESSAPATTLLAAGPLRSNPSCLLKTIENRLEILGFGEVSEVNSRSLDRIGRDQPDPSAGSRCHQPDHRRRTLHRSGPASGRLRMDRQ